VFYSTSNARSRFSFLGSAVADVRLGLVRVGQEKRSVKCSLPFQPPFSTAPTALPQTSSTNREDQEKMMSYSQEAYSIS